MVKYTFAPKLDPKGGRKDTECTWECTFNIMITIVDFGDDWGFVFASCQRALAGKFHLKYPFCLCFKLIQERAFRK